jgi:hypothetical protein
MAQMDVTSSMGCSEPLRQNDRLAHRDRLAGGPFRESPLPDPDFRAARRGQSASVRSPHGS